MNDSEWIFQLFNKMDYEQMQVDMYFSQLGRQEKQTILESMKAVLESGELEFEYSSRLGIDEKELKEIIKKFPNLDDSNDSSNETLAINNCLNEVCYGINFTEDNWRKRFTQSYEEVEKVYKRWTELRGWNYTGIR